MNVTPDSFSDGGSFDSLDAAVRRAEQMICEGADIIDIGGESTRPGSTRVTGEEEAARVLPVIEALTRLGCPVSVDTTRSTVARRALDAGAEIINDISGLRFDPEIADAASAAGAALVLMHSRGDFETMHSQPPVEDIFSEVTCEMRRSIETAVSRGVRREQLAVDVGLGFGKTYEQNLELLAKLDNIVHEFGGYPIAVGASRKSFIGKATGGSPAADRLGGSVAATIAAVHGGARIIRVHDVKETVSAIRMWAEIEKQK